MKVGRPTKYDEEMLHKANEYITGHETAIPSAAGLAMHLGVSKSTIYLWAQEQQEFSDTLEKIKTRQEVLLLEGGLTGNLNSTIVKLTLTNHGYSDKQELGINGNMNHYGEVKVKHDLSKLTVEELEKLEELTSRTIID